MTVEAIEAQEVNRDDTPGVGYELIAAALTLITGGFEAWLIRRGKAYLLHYQRRPYADPPPYPAHPPYEHPAADTLAGLEEDHWIVSGQGGYRVNLLARLHDLAADYLAERLEELAAAPAWPRTNTPEGKAEERAWAQAALAKLLAETAPRDVRQAVRGRGLGRVKKRP